MKLEFVDVYKDTTAMYGGVSWENTCKRYGFNMDAGSWVVFTNAHWLGVL